MKTNKHKPKIPKKQPTRTWLEKGKQVFITKIPQLKFVGLVIVFMALYYTITGTDTFSNQLLPWYLHILAEITGAMLSLFGFVVSVAGTMVSGSNFSMSVAYGCDGLEPTFLFVVVVAAFPSSWKKKMVGILAGISILFCLNIIRLITLFLTGVYKREYFELMHIEIWQALFIICALLLFVLWVGIPERKPKAL